jgi:putative copper export protein
MEQAIITWIHLVSAAVWVGGSLFIGAVLAPLLKKMSLSLEERIQMMVQVGRRFNKIAVPSLIILIATGLYNSQQVLISPENLLSTSYGSFLLVKILLVIALIIAFIIHVRIIRKDVEEKIISKKMTEEQIQKLRKKIIILGEIIVIISVAVLFFAALLDAGV